jgi:hypothetical protein
MAQGGPRHGGEALGSPMSEVILHLRHIQSAVVVAVAALRHQNCELDEDIAILLQRSVSDRLEEQIEKLEGARPSARGAHAARLIPL